jgi:serine/threonine protein phosphatase PrpC
MQPVSAGHYNGIVYSTMHGFLAMAVDAIMTCLQYKGTAMRKLSVFNVFDGHGGRTCSEVRPHIVAVL